MDGFVKCGKMFKATPGMVAPQVDGKIKKCSAAVAAKLYPITLNDSR